MEHNIYKIWIENLGLGLELDVSHLEISSLITMIVELIALKNHVCICIYNGYVGFEFEAGQ